jgi:hypothetical protein
MIDLPNRDPLRHAQSLLEQSQVVDLRSLSVDKKGDALVIRGEVSTFYAKQLAQETIRPALGSMRIVNRVKVCEPA